MWHMDRHPQNGELPDKQRTKLQMCSLSNQRPNLMGPNVPILHGEHSEVYSEKPRESVQVLPDKQSRHMGTQTATGSVSGPAADTGKGSAISSMATETED